MNYHSRYAIIKEGLFKNTKKILSIFHSSFTLENVDGSEKETITFEEIASIQYSSKNPKEFKIKYQNNKKNETIITFQCNYRLNLISDLQTQIDLYSKINQYPLEMFKCYISYNFDDIINDNNLILEEKDKKLQIKNKFIFDINLNLYRSIFEWIQIDSKKEMRINFYEIEKIKVIKIKNVNAILIITLNKMRLVIIPKNKDEYMTIIEKIIENSKEFLGYDILFFENENEDEFASENISQNLSSNTKTENSFDLIKKTQISQIFTFSSLNRIIFNEIKTEISLSCDGTTLFEMRENRKISKIPLTSILFIIIYEMNENFFEIILNDNSRLLYETLPNMRNRIVLNIIECLSNSDNYFFILPSKPKLGKRVRGFPQNIPDCDYETKLCRILISETGDNVKNVIEELCINLCFKDDLPQQREMIFTNIDKNMLFDKIYQEVNSCIKEIKTKKDENNKKWSDLYRLNLLLLICKNIGYEIYCPQFKQILLTCIKDIQYVSVFYNSISIIKQFLSTKCIRNKKEESTFKNEIINSVTSVDFLRNFAIDKIFNNHGNVGMNYEAQNILYLSSILDLQKCILDVAKSYPIFQDILTSLTQFDSLFLFYKLIRCESNILIQKSINILVNIIQNLTIEQESQLKSKILNRTILFFAVLLIYLKNKSPSTTNLSLIFLKSILILHVECTNLVLNLFPLTLFYHIQNKPKPINWLGPEWDKFFASLLRDYSQIKLIWNQTIRNELIDNLEKLIENYEKFTENTNVVISFAENFDANESIMPERKAISPCENVSYFFLNYKEIKIEYKTLKKEAFVWQFYLRKIINEKGSPSLYCEIDNPKKFWKKLKREILSTTSEHHIILIIKTMILLYKNYYENIGSFKEYEFFVKFYKSISSFDIKCYIIQLFLATIKLSNKEFKEQNIKQLIDIKGIDCFIIFINEVCNNDNMKNLQIKNKAFDIDISELEKNEISSFYIDNKSKPLIENEEDLLYDEKFPNYSSYKNIDEVSYKNSSKEIKIITLVVFLYKLLLKRTPILIFSNNNSQDDNFKIAFPMPKMKALFCEDKNYKTILSLLLYKNENLQQEILDFIITYLNDPLTYFSVANKFCIFDIIFIYMILYKSKILFDLLDKIYNYHRLFFDFSFLNLTEEENEFFTNYPSANKFLIRYFPINIIYFILTNNFSDFINLIYSPSIKNQNLIWNRIMLIQMLQSIQLNIEKCDLLFDPKFKCDYYLNTFEEEKGCYLYYVNMITDVTSLEKSHFNSMAKILNNKLNQDISYVNILYRIIKKFTNEVSKDNKRCIFDTCVNKYKTIISEKENVNNAQLFLYKLKILLLLDKELDDTKEMDTLILNGIEYILAMNINSQNSYEKSIIRMINYINEKKCFCAKSQNDIMLKICKCISKQIMYKLENAKLINSIMNFFYSIAKSDQCDLLLQTPLPYQFMIIMTLYNETKENETIRFNKNGSLYQISFKILKELSKKKENFNSKIKILLGDELYAKFEECNNESNEFLFFFKNEHKTPCFIWNKNLINELTSFLNSLINDMQNEIYEDNVINNFSYKTYQNELKVNGIYLYIYNQFPNYSIDNIDDFMLKLISLFDNKESSFEAKNEILFSISNAIEYDKSESTSERLTEQNFYEKFYKFVNSPQSNCTICINFIYVLSLSEETLPKIIQTQMTFCLINLIERETSKKSIEKINIILSTLYTKNYQDKVNLSIFLFLLKKLITLKQKSKKKEEIPPLKKILSLISSYLNNTLVGKGLSSLFEIYLPSKIVDNLFHSKDINENSLTKWLDADLELPDLIWNREALNQSLRLLEEDCKFILNDINNLDNFPTTFLNNKLLQGNPSRMSFFFEITNEFKINNIYLRLFNKEPNYNIGKNLVNFLQDVIDQWYIDLEDFCVFQLKQAYKNETLFLHRKIVIEMTSIMLIIEQINFNDFNNNLGIANHKEMVNVISSQEEYQNNLLPLIQRSFEYQKLLNEDVCKKLLKIYKVLYQILKNNISNDINLLYIQIIYLIFLNKSRTNIFIEKFSCNIIDFYISNIQTVSDYELVVLICIISRLCAKDISYINVFLTKYIDNFITVAQKRKNVIKYIEMLFTHILNDSQYGDSLNNIIKSKKEIFTELFSGNFIKDSMVSESELFPIWRQTPEFWDQAMSIYKSSSDNYIEDSQIETNTRNIYYRTFPIIPNSAISPFNYEDIDMSEKRAQLIISKDDTINELVSLFDELKEDSSSPESSSNTVNK